MPDRDAGLLDGQYHFCVQSEDRSAGDGVELLGDGVWALYLGLTSLIRGHEFIIEPSVTYIGGLIWLAVVSSVGHLPLLLLVGSIGPGRAGYATVVFPVFALMISSWLKAMNGALPPWRALSLFLWGTG